MGEFKQAVEKLAYQAGVIKAKPSDKKKVLEFAESIPILYKILEKVELPFFIDYCGNKTFNICEKDRGIEIRKENNKNHDYTVTFKYYRLKIVRSMNTIDPLSINNFINILDDQYEAVISLIYFLYNYLKNKVDIIGKSPDPRELIKCSFCNHMVEFPKYETKTNHYVDPEYHISETIDIGKWKSSYKKVLLAILYEEKYIECPYCKEKIILTRKMLKNLGRWKEANQQLDENDGVIEL